MNETASMKGYGLYLMDFVLVLIHDLFFIAGPPELHFFEDWLEEVWLLSF